MKGSMKKWANQVKRQTRFRTFSSQVCWPLLEQKPTQIIYRFRNFPWMFSLISKFLCFSGFTTRLKEYFQKINTSVGCKSHQRWKKTLQRTMNRVCRKPSHSFVFLLSMMVPPPFCLTLQRGVQMEEHHCHNYRLLYTMPV